MNFRISLIGGAVAAALLACSGANAQVLGGGIGGAVGGTLSGGMRDTGMLMRGGATGSLGGTLDAGSLRRTTRGALDRTTSRASSTAAAGRHRAGSMIGHARHSADVAASAAATAAGNTNAQPLGAASNLAGSGSANVLSGATQLTGAASGAAEQNAVSNLDLANSVGGQANPATATSSAGEQPVSGSGIADLTRPAAEDQSGESGAPRGIAASTGLDGSLNQDVLAGREDKQLNLSGAGNGSAAGSATASREGVSAQSSISAQGSGSAAASAQR